MSGWDRGSIGAIPLGMDQARAEYRAARATKARSRARGLSAMGSNADYHYASEADYLRIMELARDIDRNDQVVGQGINRLTHLVFRDGIQADPDTGDTALDALIAEDWREWGENRDRCDIAGERSLNSLARLLFRHTVVDGDAQAVLLDGGYIQGMEAHRLRTPASVRNDKRKTAVVHGIELSETRRHLSYWFTRDPIALNEVVGTMADIVKVPAYDPEGYRQVLHLYRPERLTQTRGVSALARVMETAGQHDDLQWAQLVKAQVSACFTIFREVAANTVLPTGSAPLGTRTEEYGSDGFTKVLEQLAPGMVIQGRPGEKLHGFSANTPNEEFFKHSWLILSIISVNLDIPVIVLMLDPSATNFSGWRGAMDAAKPALQRFRAQMVEQFYQPVYAWRVRQLLADNPEAARLALATGVDPFRCHWKPPHDPYIEPSKDAEADKTIVTEGLNSRRNVLAARGLDIEVIDRHRVEDRKNLLRLAHLAAKEITDEFAESDITWRDLIPADTKSDQMIHVAQIEKTKAVEVAEEQAEPMPNKSNETDDPADDAEEDNSDA